MTSVANRVLIVEDDVDVAQVAKAYLDREGFDVEVAKDGPSGLRAAAERPPALVVLDWMLPELDGLTVLDRLRRERHVPVILLTAKTEEADRIAAFEHGADDYVPKPFSPRELVARVRAVLRRSGAEDTYDGGIVTHGGLELDPSRRTARFEGKSVALTTLEFDLLHTLARSPGRVFTRSDLLDRVWGEDFYGVERVVDVHVSNLRQKLARFGGDALVDTVRGVGYTLR